VTSCRVAGLVWAICVAIALPTVGGQMTERLLELLFGHRLKSTALTNTGRARVWAQHDAAVIQDLVDEVTPRQLAG